MTDKTPVRVVFNNSNVATGMAEFQSGETVPVSNGGTGLSSIGTAGQVLKVNSAGTGLVFAGEGDISIQNLVAPTNADLSLRTSGTGGIILNDITISDNSISTNRSNDDFFINASGSGTVILENLKVGTGATVTTILDEDNFATNSATALATQQSIKAYIDSEVGAVSTTQIASGDTSVAVTDDGSGTITFTVDGSSVGTYTANGLQLGGSGARVTTVLDEDNLATNSDTALATQQSIKAYIDAQNTAQAITFVGDDSTGTAVNSGETFQITGGTGLTSAVSGDTMTLAIDSTVATLTGSQTLTNKTLTTPIIEQISNTGTLTLPTSTDTLVGRATTDTLTNKTLTNPTINGGTFSGTFTGTISPGQVTTNSIVSNGSNADISIQPSGTGDVIISALRINGTTLDSSDSTKITIAEAVDITGAVTTGAITSSGNITSGGSFIIGSADIDETDFEKIDGITDGTVAANKAVVVDSNADASGFRNVSATGTLTITGATSLNGGATILGGVTAGSLTTNEIASNGSNADLTITPQGTGDINLTAGADINIPANIGLTFGDDGEKIEGDGTDLTISSSRNVTIDVDSAINFDANSNGIVNFKDGGSKYFVVQKSSSSAVLSVDATDGDMIFKGDDGGAVITALTLDMSEAGAATFNAGATFNGAVSITGNLTVSGDTTTVSSTNTTIEDNLIELNTGISQSLNDAGIIIERGTTGNNAAIIWDESADTFVLGTTTATAADKSGGITIDAGSLKIASLEVDGVTITDNTIGANASNSSLELEASGTGDIDLNAGADVNIPANIGLTFGDDGEKIEGDGTNLSITSSNSLGIDTANGITLDSGSGGAVLKAGGSTTYGTLTSSSGDFSINQTTSDKDIIFTGNDGGATITALTLDMSEAGAATFNSTVESTGNFVTGAPTLGNDEATFGFNAPNAELKAKNSSGSPAANFDIHTTNSSGTTARVLRATHDGILQLMSGDTVVGKLSNSSSDFVIESDVQDKDIIFKGDDGGSGITALTLDMSEAGAATFNDKIILGTNKEIQFVDTNESIKSDGSKLIVTSGGTAFNLPTADGSNGNALITDGSGTLSFGAVGEKSTSDDTLAVAVTNKRITTTARSIDAFAESFADSVLYYVCTNDHHLDVVNMQKISLCHNDTGPFFAHGGIQSANGALPTLSIESSNNIVRLKSVSTNAVGGNVSFYKISLGDNTSTGTNGSVIVSQNTDVDSASESLVSFAHATFRGAKLFVSVNNNAKTEISNFEALVVHDGTEAFISQYNVVNTGSNDLALLTAAIDGDNVVISASGLEPNLRITVHAIMLKDTMTADSSTYANIETIAPVTVSSSETEFDTLEQRTSNGAVYFLVSKNATEGEFAINEIMVAVGTNDVSHVNVGAISTKGTNQLQASTDFKSTAELQGTLNLASTSGANTTVSAYKIKLHAS